MSNGNGVTAAISSAAETVGEKASELGSVIAGGANMAVAAAKKTKAGKAVASAANKAAEAVYNAVRQDGHQQNVIELMQTRAELYERIGSHAFEQKLDALFAAKK